MSYKWFILVAALMSGVPGYLMWLGDGFGAILVAVPSLFIGLMGCWLIRQLSDV